MSKRFQAGDRVELSGKGMRYLKRVNPKGTVIGTNFKWVKVKFDDKSESEWFEPTWFVLISEIRVSGL